MRLFRADRIRAASSAADPHPLPAGIPLRPTPVRRKWTAVLTSFAMALAALGAVGTLQVVQSQSAAAAVPVNYAKTPPMGFNDWNSFGCKVDEQLIKQTADLFLSKGLKAASTTPTSTSTTAG